MPTIQLSHMSEAQKRAYILADNHIFEQPSSKLLLRTELRGLHDLRYEAELSGVDTLETATLLTLDEDEQVDDNVYLPQRVDVVSRLGILWHIGPRQLIVGNARDPLTYEKLLPGERAQMAFTDPPYGCRIAGNGRVVHGQFVKGSSGVLDAEFLMG